MTAAKTATTAYRANNFCWILTKCVVFSADPARHNEGAARVHELPVEELRAGRQARNPNWWESFPPPAGHGHGGGWHTALLLPPAAANCESAVHSSLSILTPLTWKGTTKMYPAIQSLLSRSVLQLLCLLAHSTAWIWRVTLCRVLCAAPRSASPREGHSCWPMGWACSCGWEPAYPQSSSRGSSTCRPSHTSAPRLWVDAD